MPIAGKLIALVAMASWHKALWVLFVTVTTFGVTLLCSQQLDTMMKDARDAKCLN